MRKRVVMWSHLPPAGGGLTVVARNLAADPDLNERYDMQFLGTHEAPPDLVGRVHPSNLWRAVRDAWSLFRQCRGAALVEILSSGETTTVLMRGLLLTLAARLAGARVAFYLGSGRLYPVDPDDFTPNRGMPQFFRLLGWFVDVYVIIDDNARPVLARMIGARTRVVTIPPPLDTDHFASPPRPPTDRPVLLHAGRITREKGVVDLLEACRLLDQRGVATWDLRLVGPPERSTAEELAEIRALAASLGDRVTFVGWLDDIAPELARADVFVSASHQEGLSGAIAEACAAGLPVVATDVGATRNVVRDGVDGFIVPAHRPVEFADATQKLLADHGLRVEMGASAHRHAVDLYGRRQVAAMYVELIEELTR